MFTLVVKGFEIASKGMVGLIKEHLGWSGLFYVGSYGKTDEYTIHVCRLNQENGELAVLQKLDDAPNASFLALHPSGDMLYAVKELAEHNGTPGGSLISIPVDPNTGLLGDIGEDFPSFGAHPCYVSVATDGTMAFTANYSGGSVALHPLGENGIPTGGDGTAHYIHECKPGPVADRQEAPHAHCIIPLPGTPFLYVADLGMDAVVVYRVTETARLERVGECDLTPGSGPRHLAFHPYEPFAYVTNELASGVTVLRVDRESGLLTVLQTVASIPESYDGYNDSADIHLSPDGKFLYSSNRGHDSIAVFQVEDGTGHLTPLQFHSSGGVQPRNFGITPGGDFLLAANQKSGNIAVLRIDKVKGTLTATSQSLQLSSPVNITFGR
ncbi:lactonase family protein [Paenibacillus sp. CAU 1782]